MKQENHYHCNLLECRKTKPMVKIQVSPPPNNTIKLVIIFSVTDLETLPDNSEFTSNQTDVSVVLVVMEFYAT